MQLSKVLKPGTNRHQYGEFAVPWGEVQAIGWNCMQLMQLLSLPWMSVQISECYRTSSLYPVLHDGSDSLSLEGWKTGAWTKSVIS